MDISTIQTGVSAVLALAASVTVVAAVMALPRAWRDRAWAYECGTDDERRAGDSAFLAGLGRAAGSIAFAAAGVRWYLTDVSNPHEVLVIAVIGVVFAVTMLAAILRFYR